MRTKESLRGLYVITDDRLTPKESLFQSVELALQGGAKIVQLRDKHSSDEEIVETIKALEQLCRSYDALFVLNDRVELAIRLECSALHIGKSDHYRFEEIRQNFKGIVGVSCYGDLNLAQKMEAMGADYVAFGSLFASPTKPHANIIDLALLTHAKALLNVPICVIGGIHSDNAPDLVTHYKPDMVAVISDIWTNEIQKQAQFYTNLYQGERK